MDRRKMVATVVKKNSKGTVAILPTGISSVGTGRRGATLRNRGTLKDARGALKPTKSGVEQVKSSRVHGGAGRADGAAVSGTATTNVKPANQRHESNPSKRGGISRARLAETRTTTITTGDSTKPVLLSRSVSATSITSTTSSTSAPNEDLEMKKRKAFVVGARLRGKDQQFGLDPTIAVGTSNRTNGGGEGPLFAMDYEDEEGGGGGDDGIGSGPPKRPNPTRRTSKSSKSKLLPASAGAAHSSPVCGGDDNPFLSSDPLTNSTVTNKTTTATTTNFEGSNGTGKGAGLRSKGVAEGGARLVRRASMLERGGGGESDGSEGEVGGCGGVGSGDQRGSFIERGMATAAAIRGVHRVGAMRSHSFSEFSSRDENGGSGFGAGGGGGMASRRAGVNRSRNSVGGSSSTTSSTATSTTTANPNRRLPPTAAPPPVPASPMQQSEDDDGPTILVKETPLATQKSQSYQFDRILESPIGVACGGG
ncbi:hypothetical protein HK102_010073, partial [Quaeritorhiza haematococci]